MKVFGRGLMGIGLLLMVIGTASVPSTSWAAVIVAKQCAAACDHCGSAQNQGNGIYRCFVTDKNGVHVEGTCDKSGTDCELCSGGCEKILINEEPACTCLKINAADPE